MARIAETDEAILRCFEVMAELRTHLRQAEFVAQVREMQSEGYRLAYLEAEGAVVAVAGYRITTNFFMGRHLYVEDLVTAGRVRSRGYGRTLLDWLVEHAEAAGCDFVNLDSGVQRSGAHRFYFGHDFTIFCYHFARKIRDL